MASSFCLRLAAGSQRSGLLILLYVASVSTLRADNSTATFYRGLNLNGPPVTIDGQRWEGKDAKHYLCKDKAFEAQQVNLLPSTDAERALMIRSSRWGGNRIELADVPNGRYSVFLYVWEDNNPETYDIAVNGREVKHRYNSGSEGRWERLGPWFTEVEDKKIVITSRGGAANFSGIEVWRGEHDGENVQVLSAEALTFFEQRIRPLFVERCYECHSEQSEEVAGRLLVDSAPTIRRGGVSGAAVVPGDLEHSLLITAVRYENDEIQMPPDGKLSDVEIASLEEWVRMGAPDPRRSATRIPAKSIDVEKAREFWSFKPLANPVPPVVQDATWPVNDLDRFILAALERRKLAPVGQADKRTLIRRATFDLTGLPPTPADIDAFLNDQSPQAFERVVDRLLGSRQYGERWGRHWMDLVRYADTAGENSDYPIPQVYRYRNYIIDSFNSDKPYDEFLQEQIAGDLLPAASDAEQNEHTIATGYLAISRRFGSVIENYPQHLTIEDTIDNLGRVVLGLTLSCTRCHDHKFDPLLQTDYYGLYGIFESTKYAFPGIELDKVPRDFVALVKDGKPSEELAYAVADDQVGDAYLQIRGEPTQPGDLVPRKFPDLFGGQRLSDEQSRQSGRLQLAQWLTDRDNPLTARVMANRIWQYHFGSGLVKTPSDFGSRGQLPTHPELLDWLATRFMESNWSIKYMHRLIMNSRTYQLDSKSDTTLSSSIILHPPSIDPNNELHWRFSRHRLDAESLRDALLMISGELDASMMVEPHPFPPVEKWQFTQHHPFRDSYDSNRRSVYLMTARLNAKPFFTTFDGADRNASTAIRDSSVTTVQALYLLNDEFIHRCATAFSGRLLREEENSADRLKAAFESTIGRPPSDNERSIADEFLRQLRDKLLAARYA